MIRAQTSHQSFGPRALGAAICTVVAMSVVPVTTPAASAATDRLRVTFDTDGVPGTRLVAGSAVADSSGNGNNGIVRTAFGGSVLLASGATGGVVADFPGKCGVEPCPNALVEIADHDSLDPGTADFEWGALIVLLPSETADGENVLQKGVWGQNGGQWKLQIDKEAGIPSCVVSGVVPGETTERRVVLKAGIGVADGASHRLVCRRAGGRLEIFIDGVRRRSAAMPGVNLASSAPVTIGAKSYKPRSNDQFHGVVDDVFMTVL